MLTLYAESLMDLYPWAYWNEDGSPKEHTAALVTAIEKAMAARQAAADLSPGDMARDQLDKLQQRLEKSRARLATSRSGG